MGETSVDAACARSHVSIIREETPMPRDDTASAPKHPAPAPDVEAPLPFRFTDWAAI